MVTYLEAALQPMELVRSHDPRTLWENDTKKNTPLGMRIVSYVDSNRWTRIFCDISQTSQMEIIEKSNKLPA